MPYVDSAMTATLSLLLYCSRKIQPLWRSNHNRPRLLDFAGLRNEVICSIICRHKKIYQPRRSHLWRVNGRIKNSTPIPSLSLQFGASSRKYQVKPSRAPPFASKRNGGLSIPCFFLLRVTFSKLKYSFSVRRLDIHSLSYNNVIV